MSFTGNTTSSTPVPAPFWLDQTENMLEWKSMGALGLQDPTYGLEFQEWHGVCSKNEKSETKVKLIPQKEGDVIEIVFPDFPIEQFSFTFDQNMFPIIAYTSCDVAKFYWYDTTVQQYKLETLSSTVSPMVMMDDGRQFNIGGSDAILAYIRDNGDTTYDLCFKLQRDRYGVVYVLATDVGVKRLKTIGLNNQLRFQFELVDRYGYSGKLPTCKESSA